MSNEMDIRQLAARAEQLHRDLANTRCIVLDEPGLYTDAKRLYDSLKDFVEAIAAKDALAAQGCLPKREVPHPTLAWARPDRLDVIRWTNSELVAQEAAANPEPCWENPCCCQMPECRS